MKAKLNIILLLVCGLVVPFSSCTDDGGDTMSPMINLITPAEGAELVVGTNMELIIEFMDNEMLQSYKLEIHNNFNGHGHGEDHDHDHDHSKSLKSESVTESFFVQKAWNISGRNFRADHSEISIWENATPGKYHLMIYCTDASGNESYVARNIVIVDKDHNHDHDH